MLKDTRYMCIRKDPCLPQAQCSNMGLANSRHQVHACVLTMPTRLLSAEMLLLAVAESV